MKQGGKDLINLFLCYISETEAYGKGIVNLVHIAASKLSHTLLQPFFIQSPNLFGEYDRIFRQTERTRTQLDMGRHFCFIDLRSNRRGDNSGTIPVSYIVLYNKYRSDSALFAADNRAEIGVINIASFNLFIQDSVTLRWERFSARWLYIHFSHETGGL